MDKFKFVKHINIAKIDDEERMVYGFASTPDMDTDGEIITADAMTKALPAYLKFPTLREMHQAKAVGTTKQAEATKKGLYIGAKVVADDAWKLVKEGVYKAFSIGGNVVKRVGNVINEIELIEISLVDSPANKSAVIDLWKRENMTKDAESVYSLANFMIQVKDMIYMCEYSGKPTKQLEKILELLKTMIATEATGEEPSKIMMSDNPDDIKKVIAALDKIDFSNNKLAEMLRKGVSISMTKKLEKVTKGDEVEEAEVKTEVTEAETTESETSKPEDTETKTEESKEESKDETETETETKDEEVSEDAESKGETKESEGEDESSEDKEAVDDPTLKKLADVNKKMEEMTPTKKEEVEKHESLTKAVSSIVNTLGKMADTMADLKDRVEKVEATPAAVKSKAVTVFKSIVQDDEKKSDEGDESVSKSVKEKQDRLVELEKKFDEMGPNKFAKAGLSKEAAKLKMDLDAIQPRA